MSLYKTQRCRHFDEGGDPIRPYCSQGNKCRFIHPNDHQWAKLKRRNDDTPSPQDRDPGRSKGKIKPRPSSPSPRPRHHSPPSIPQNDLPRRKQRDPPREHDSRDWFHRRGSDSWGVAQERNGPSDRGYSLKRASNEEHSYPTQRPRLSEGSLHGSASNGGNNTTRHPIQTGKVPAPRSLGYDPKPTRSLSDTFHRLAKLCCEIVQDTCFLDRDQDKLKAFTGLSSELTKAVPDAAMAVTPALATVINGHTRTRERLENHVGELEALWKTLFSTLEGDISKIIDSRLEQAMALMDKGRDDALQAITHAQKLACDRLCDGPIGPRQRPDGWKETMENSTVLSQRASNSVNGSGGTTLDVLPEETHCHEGSTSLPLVPAQGDLGACIRIVLEDMKMQMDRQTRAMELLAKENLQLKTVSERPQPQPELPTSSSTRKLSGA